MSGKLFGAVKSLYSSICACVRVNNFTTEWFNVNRGVRQGCCLLRRFYSRKGNVVHFRPNSEQRFDFDFTCGTNKIGTVDRYSYLGITLMEFLDFDVTAKIVVHSAGQVLGFFDC